MTHTNFGSPVTPFKLVLYIVAMVTASSCNQNSGLVGVETVQEDDRKALKYLKEVEWPKAYREQDTLLLDRILGDDFQMIEADGNWSNKQLELKWIKENSTSSDSFYYEIKRLDVFDHGTAIVAGTGHVFKDSVETIYQSSNVLIKRNGIWKAISSHVSGVKKIE